MLKEAYLQVEEEGEEAEMKFWACKEKQTKKKKHLEADEEGAVRHCWKVRLHENTPEAARGEKGRFRLGNESENYMKKNKQKHFAVSRWQPDSAQRRNHNGSDCGSQNTPSSHARLHGAECWKRQQK